MTESEKQQIQELRLEGMGYKAIAAIMGMTRDRVRSYCKRNGLGGGAQVVVLNVEERIKNHQLCTCCKKPLKQKGRGWARKFCSEDCRRTWWKENAQARKRNETAVYHFTCHQCGKDFSVYGNRKRKYCCHDCYINSRYWSEEDGISEDNH